MGLIHTRSRRDECGACASTIRSIRYLMLDRLSERTREIPEVAELMEILEEVERGYWEDQRQADRDLQSEATSARAALRRIGSSG